MSAGWRWRASRSLQRLEEAVDVGRVECGGSITPSACSVASRRTLWSPTRPTALITTRLGAIRPADRLNGTPRRIATGTVIKPIGARAVGKVVNDDRADWREAWALFPGSVAYIWHAGTKAGIVQDSLAACGFETRSQIIWAKNNFAIGRGHYHCKHEPCWYVVRKGSTASWVGDHSQTTLWQIDKNLKSETGHGTQGPGEIVQFHSPWLIAQIARLSRDGPLVWINRPTRRRSRHAGRTISATARHLRNGPRHICADR